MTVFILMYETEKSGAQLIQKKNLESRASETWFHSHYQETKTFLALMFQATKETHIQKLWPHILEQDPLVSVDSRRVDNRETWQRKESAKWNGKMSEGGASLQPLLHTVRKSSFIIFTSQCHGLLWL